VGADNPRVTKVICWVDLPSLIVALATTPTELLDAWHCHIFCLGQLLGNMPFIDADNANNSLIIDTNSGMKIVLDLLVFVIV
jgi:hypothetical protein